MNALKIVFVRIFSIVFSFIKNLQTRNKQYTNKKLSLPGDIIIYTLDDLVMDKKHSTFSNSSCLLEDKSFMKFMKQHVLLELFLENKCF